MRLLESRLMASVSRTRVTAQCAVVVLFTILSGHTRAWGTEGHHIVARLAWSQMTPAAKRAAQDLLGAEDFVASSTWADEVRAERPETYNWHFVDIPYDQYGYDAARDCVPSPRGDCVVAELERARHALMDKALPKAQRAEALKFVIHFVGDLHQPLHAIDNHDRGGNDVHVTVAGHASTDRGGLTLHAVWDSTLIAERGIDETAYVDTLRQELNQYPPSAGPIDFASWAGEAHQRALEYAYTYPGFTPGRPPSGVVELSADYQKQALLAIDHQFELAGIRLAAVLNEALASGTPRRP